MFYLCCVLFWARHFIRSFYFLYFVEFNNSNFFIYIYLYI